MEDQLASTEHSVSGQQVNLPVSHPGAHAYLLADGNDPADLPHPEHPVHGNADGRHPRPCVIRCFSGCFCVLPGFGIHLNPDDGVSCVLPLMVLTPLIGESRLSEQVRIKMSRLAFTAGQHIKTVRMQILEKAGDQPFRSKPISNRP